MKFRRSVNRYIYVRFVPNFHLKYEKINSIILPVPEVLRQCWSPRETSSQLNLNNLKLNQTFKWQLHTLSSFRLITMRRQAGRSPLHSAVLLGHTGTVKALIRAGADLNAVSKVPDQ